MKKARVDRSLRAALAACLAALTLGMSMPAKAESPPSAADIAREKNEGRRIEQRFNDDVAAIVGVPDSRIAGLLPDDRRITVRSERMIEAIEGRVRQLSGEEKAAIRRADQQRRDALGKLRK